MKSPKHQVQNVGQLAAKWGLCSAIGSGESIYDLSREIGVATSEIEQWHLKAHSGLSESLKSRGGDPLQKELKRAKQQIDPLSIEVGLLREKGKHSGRCFLGREVV